MGSFAVCLACLFSVFSHAVPQHSHTTSPSPHNTLSCAFFAPGQGSAASPSPPGKMSPLPGPAIHSFFGSPTRFLPLPLHWSLGRWAISIYLNVYRGCPWIARLCVLLVSSWCFQIFSFLSLQCIIPTIIFINGKKNDCQCLKNHGGYFMAVPPAMPQDCQSQKSGCLCFVFEAQNLWCASCMYIRWMNELEGRRGQQLSWQLKTRSKPRFIIWKVSDKSYWSRQRRLINCSSGFSWPLSPAASAGGVHSSLAGVCVPLSPLIFLRQSTWHNRHSLFIAVVSLDVTSGICRLSGILQTCFLCLLWCQFAQFLFRRSEPFKHEAPRDEWAFIGGSLLFTQWEPAVLSAVFNFQPDFPNLWLSGQGQRETGPEGSGICPWHQQGGSHSQKGEKLPPSPAGSGGLEM